MRLRLGLATAGLAIALTACAGNSGNSVAAQPPTVNQVAQQVGATNVQPTDPTLYADKEASASLHGETVDIVTFTSQEKRDNWITVASQFETVIAKGPLWAVAK